MLPILCLHPNVYHQLPELLPDFFPLMSDSARKKRCAQHTPMFHRTVGRGRICDSRHHQHDVLENSLSTFAWGHICYIPHLIPCVSHLCHWLSCIVGRRSAFIVFGKRMIRAMERHNSPKHTFGHGICFRLGKQLLIYFFTTCRLLSVLYYECITNGLIRTHHGFPLLAPQHQEPPSAPSHCVYM